MENLGLKNKCSYVFKKCYAVVLLIFCQMLFSIGGLIAYLTVFQFFILFYSSKEKKEKKTRVFISSLFSFFLSLLKFFRLIETDIKIEAIKKQNKGQFIICNHPSLLDVVVVMSIFKGAQCIVKHELWNNLFLFGVVRAAGFISNGFDGEKIISLCKQSLMAGESVILFPEGTRSIPGKKMKLQRGLARLALATKADIQALLINFSEKTLAKNDKWYDAPEKMVKITLELGPEFLYKNYTAGNKPESISARHLTRGIEDYYNRRLNNG